MRKQTFKVVNKLGIHVRVACDILQVGKENDCCLSAKKSKGDGEVVALKFPLALVAMQARYGEEIEICADGKTSQSEIVTLQEIDRILREEHF